MTAQTVFNVEHACGHMQERDVADTAASLRQEKVAWWGTQNCTPCFAASKPKRPVSREIRAEWDALSKEARADQERMNLPPLQGSDKQVKWGTDERFKILRSMYEDLVQSDRLSEDEYDEQVTSLARRIDRAKWWIDHRDSTVDDLLADLQDPGEQYLGTENPY